MSCEDPFRSIDSDDVLIDNEIVSKVKLHLPQYLTVAVQLAFTDPPTATTMGNWRLLHVFDSFVQCNYCSHLPGQVDRLQHPRGKSCSDSYW